MLKMTFLSNRKLFWTLHSNVTDIDTKKEHVFPQKVDTRNKKKNGQRKFPKKGTDTKVPKKKSRMITICRENTYVFHTGKHACQLFVEMHVLVSTI